MRKIGICFSLIVLLASCNAPRQTTSPETNTQAQATTDGLVAYYTFEGNGKDQVGTYHAKPYKGVPLKFEYVDQTHKRALNFSIAEQSRAVIDNTFDYEHKTICLRVKADVIDANPAVVFVSDNPRKQYGLAGVVMKEEEGEKKLFFNLASNPVGVPVSEGQWYHVALVGAARSYAYYLNGSLIAKGPINQYKSSSKGAVATILGSSRIFSIFFSGSIDDLRVYNRALTAEEIAVIAKN